jgi:hypothetical protein
MLIPTRQGGRSGWGMADAAREIFFLFSARRNVGESMVERRQSRGACVRTEMGCCQGPADCCGRSCGLSGSAPFCSAPILRLRRPPKHARNRNSQLDYSPSSFALSSLGTLHKASTVGDRRTQVTGWAHAQLRAHPFAHPLTGGATSTYSCANAAA